LKDLCYGKISVSKMSCIENDKVNLEPEVLEFIAEKLDIDINYLKENIQEQITKNISICHDTFGSLNYEDEMLYNLEISEAYGYFNSAFNIVHCLFSYYLKSKSNEKLQNILAKYYELCFKAEDEENYIIYSMDIGKYLFINKEYQQATNYYKAARSNALNFKKNKMYIVDAILQEARCYEMLKDYKDAYNIAKLLLEYENNIDDNNKLAEIYHFVAILSLRNNVSDFEKLESKAKDANEENFYMKAEDKFDYAIIFFENGHKNKALKYLKESVEVYPKEDKLRLTRFILKNINILLENGEIEIADSFCEDSLNLAINLNNDKLIERAYYYKSLILCAQSNFISAEMYINLSLDVLTKFGKKNEIYTRYMEIGNMYNKIGAISDSLKYFSLAIALTKKI
jgi:tetratricopeptide (TPR) repeat protein